MTEDEARKWQPIETAPTGDDDFFLVCGEGDSRPFVIRGTILADARKENTPAHLQMRWLIYWMPLPAMPNADSH
jgi:hypothetical protein